MTRLWIVYGSSGEYSDRTEWPVCWRGSEAEAVEVARILNEQADQYLALLGNRSAPETARAQSMRLAMLDPAVNHRRFGYDLLSYDVVSVPEDISDSVYPALPDCGKCAACLREAAGCGHLPEEGGGTACWVCRPENFVRPECGHGWDLASEALFDRVPSTIERHNTYCESCEGHHLRGGCVR